MLGGPGGQQPTRQLTDIETTLVTGLLEQMVGVLRYALEPIVAVVPTLGPIEYNSQFVQAAGATDAMLVGLFDMAIGTEQCQLSLCLPLAPLLPRLMAQRAREDRASGTAHDTVDAGALRERLGELPVDLAVQFRPVRLSPSRILELAVGDVLPLDHRLGLPLTVRVGGVGFASAIAGRAGSRLAALITETPQEQA
jgi:flagellar motor switch protein FliM